MKEKILEIIEQHKNGLISEEKTARLLEKLGKASNRELRKSAVASLSELKELRIRVTNSSKKVLEHGKSAKEFIKKDLLSSLSTQLVRVQSPKRNTQPFSRITTSPAGEGGGFVEQALRPVKSTKIVLPEVDGRQTRPE